MKRRRRPVRRADFAFVADDEMVSLAAEVLAEAAIQDELEPDGHSLGMGGVDEVGRRGAKRAIPTAPAWSAEVVKVWRRA